VLKGGGDLWVVGLGGGEQGLQTEEGGLQGEGRAPLVLQHVQADGPICTGDVGMPANLWRLLTPSSIAISMIG